MVQSMSDQISRSSIDFDSRERFISLRRALDVESFGINQMTLLPGQRGRIHRHLEQEEVYVVLQGRLTLVVEGDALELDAGEVVRLPPRVRRQLANDGEEPCVVLALGGSGTHVGRDGEAFQSWDATEGHAPRDVPLPPDA
jgi:mannose-6-phosphate isomerase-like protein (cupin superfamily)